MWVWYRNRPLGTRFAVLKFNPTISIADHTRIPILYSSFSNTILFVFFLS